MSCPSKLQRPPLDPYMTDSVLDTVAFDRWMVVTGTTNLTVAQAINVSHSTIQNWRKGISYPHPNVMSLIARFIRERNQELLEATCIEVVHYYSGNGQFVSQSGKLQPPVVHDV